CSASSQEFSWEEAWAFVLRVSSGEERSSLMILVPLTQAAHRLGIDLKTLRCWLTRAQLPVHADPQDARKKGIGVEHLHLLATLHQRSVTSDAAEGSALLEPPPVPLPAVVLALPELLWALHAQITALEQQVATLTHLIQRPALAAPEQTPK